MGAAFSVCWILGTVCLAACLFLLAAACKNGVVASLTSVVASLALAFACLEGWMLATSQATDGLLDDSANSRYVLSGQALQRQPKQMLPYGQFPAALGQPYAVAQRTVKYDRTLFDVRYGFDALGHRVSPISNEPPRAEIMVFGCSYTFGHGLEDGQTWPWLLGEALGPDWRITNYAYKGFGAHQMLTLLQEGAVSKLEVKKREAVFLAIYHHLQRNEGLLDSSPCTHYALEKDSGELIRAGWSNDDYAVLFALPRFFNGSQLVAHICRLLTDGIAKQRHKAFLATYVAILDASARLLREEYDATLTVVLWPDAEYLAPLLRERGITSLNARMMMPEWDATSGAAYYIDPQYERHPNAEAANDIAAALAKYFAKRDF
ncbi:MAG: hypothetical protein Q4F27_02050 [Desulfovibrionaceae bacterium]|nr:hypothetical protein [Desulfovibrionaceae bacterium]